MQIVLIDMVFNLGRDGFSWKRKEIIDKEGNKVKKGYPSFWDAVANRDVDKMIKECARDGLPKRNKKIKRGYENLRM